jgi:hypothetical protein
MDQFNLQQYLQQLQQQQNPLQQATAGNMGGIDPMQQQDPQQQAQQFDPRVLEAMGLSQGYDAEDERLARQQAQVAALRERGQSPITSPGASGAWAQGAANALNSGFAAIKERRADKAQKVADQQRMQGMRDFSTAYRGAEGYQPDGKLRVPFSPSYKPEAAKTKVPFWQRF